jgi:hypothetical protein
LQFKWVIWLRSHFSQQTFTKFIRDMELAVWPVYPVHSYCDQMMSMFLMSPVGYISTCETLHSLHPKKHACMSVPGPVTYGTLQSDAQTLTESQFTNDVDSISDFASISVECTSFLVSKEIVL